MNIGQPSLALCLFLYLHELVIDLQLSHVAARPLPAHPAGLGQTAVSESVSLSLSGSVCIWVCLYQCFCLGLSVSVSGSVSLSGPVSVSLSGSVCSCVSVWVCISVSIWVCLFLCLHLGLSVPVPLSGSVCIWVCLYQCFCLGLSVSVSLSGSVCVSVSVRVCLYQCLCPGLSVSGSVWVFLFLGLCLGLCVSVSLPVNCDGSPVLFCSCDVADFHQLTLLGKGRQLPPGQLTGFVPCINLPMKPVYLNPFPSPIDALDPRYAEPILITLKSSQKYFIPATSVVPQLAPSS